MNLRCAVLLFVLCGMRLAAAVDTIEGCHLPDNNQPFLAVNCTNCAEQGPDGNADFVQAWCYMRHPDVAGGIGYTSTCFCTYHDTDLLMGLAPGVYDVAGSRCPVGFRAVVTRWQLADQSGGGDGGCDAPGPVCTPGLPCTAALISPPSADLRFGRCKVGRDHRVRWCRWRPHRKP